MKHCLLFLLLLSVVSLHAQLSGNNPVWVYPANVRVERQVKVEPASTEPLKVYPPGTHPDSLRRWMPYGTYVVEEINGLYRTRRCLHVCPKTTVEMVSTFPDLRLKVALEGVKPDRITVANGETEAAYDSVTQVFTLPRSPLHNHDHLVLTVTFPGGETWLRLKNGFHTEKRWIHTAGLQLISRKEKRQWYEPKAYYGYAMFSQPKYKPGDTARYKVFVVDKRGQPLTDTLRVRLHQNSGFIRDVSLLPAHPGAYTGEIVLSDTVGLKMDMALRMNVFHKGVYIGIERSAEIEAYKLKEITYTVTPPREWLPDTEYEIAVTALDANKRPAPDVQMTVEIILGRIAGFPDTLKSTYVPDTLFRYKGPLQSVVLPAGLHPGVHAHWWGTVVFINGANEQNAQQVSFSSVLAPGAVSQQYRPASSASATHTQLTDSSRLKLPPSALIVTYELPEQTAPGAEVDVTVRVTDRDGLPVAGADVLAVGINSMMDQSGFVPALPATMQQPEKVEVEQFTSALSPVAMPGQLGGADRLGMQELVALGLDSAAYYRLIWPDSVATHVLPLAHPGKPQVAPFVYHEGTQERVMMIWASDRFAEHNRRLVYHAWLGHYCPEMPETDSVTLFVRTRTALYTVRGVKPLKDNRLILSFSPENLPATISREARPDSLIPSEIEELNRLNFIFDLSKLSGGRGGYVYPEGRWQQGVHASEEKMLFPFQPGDEVVIESPGSWKRSFHPRENGTYTLKEEIIERDPKPFFTDKTKFPTPNQPFIDHKRLIPNRDSLLSELQFLRATGRGREIPMRHAQNQYGKYYSKYTILAIMQPGNTINSWKTNGYAGIAHRLPEGTWMLVLMNRHDQLALQTVTIRANHTLLENIPVSAFGPHPELRARLSAQFKVENGQFANNLLSVGTQTISGTVSPEAKALGLVTGATVLLLDKTLQVAGTFTDAQGKFTFTNVHCPDCHVIVVKDGFVPADVPVKESGSITLVVAKPQPGGLWQHYPFEYREMPEPELFFRDLSVCEAHVPVFLRSYHLKKGYIYCNGINYNKTYPVYNLSGNFIEYDSKLNEIIGLKNQLSELQTLELSQSVTISRNEQNINLHRSKNAVQSFLPKRKVDQIEIDASPAPAQDSFLNPFEALQLRTRFADCAWWQPLLVTDSLGVAHFRTTLPEDITAWNGYAIAMTGQKQAGWGKGSVRAQKPVEARLSVPDFLTTADTAQTIGRVIGQPGDTLAVTLRYGQSGQPLTEATDTLRTSLKRTFPLITSAKDTALRAEFAVTLPGGPTDGEQRSVPVFPVGVREAFGTLLTLMGDTSLVFAPPTPSMFRLRSATIGSGAGIADAEALEAPALPVAPIPLEAPALLSLSADNLFPLLREVEALRAYPYTCNEQAASRLAGLLAARAMDAAQGKPNTDADEIRRLVKKLSSGQNASGMWGWFPGMGDYPWLSALILRRVYAADSTAACVKKAQTALTQRIEQDTALETSVQVAILTALAETRAPLDYDRLMARVKADTSTNGIAAWAVLKTRLAKPVDTEAKALLARAKPTILGGLYWDNWTWVWYGSGWETTLLAYEVLKHAGDSTGRKRAQVRQGILELSLPARMNTLQSATMLATVLPDVLAEKAALTPPTISVEGDGVDLHVTQFPVQHRVPAGQPLTIVKRGLGPVYLSYDVERWNPAPAPMDSLFAVSTRLEQDGKSLTRLRAGEKADLVVTVAARYAATYMALDVPIPAGCTYASRPQPGGAHDCHREYDYHQTTIYLERIGAGSYTYRIPLEARFSGSFVLNPARIFMMYMPHKQGFNGVRRVKVE